MINLDEIFERIKICDGERRIGYVSVRYPVIGNKRIDKYYRELADAFVKKAEKEKLTGMLCCSVSYEDENDISVITETRLYKDSEGICRHRSSFVWNKKQGTLRYIRKHGIRQSNVYYDGRELKKFD